MFLLEILIDQTLRFVINHVQVDENNLTETQYMALSWRSTSRQILTARIKIFANKAPQKKEQKVGESSSSS